MNSENIKFEEKLISIDTHDGYKLKGKISYPQQIDNKMPAVLIIHGSGQIDMDGNVEESYTYDGKPAKLQLQYAEALNKAGCIVLRYNKRGISFEDNEIKVDEDIFSTMTVDNLKKDACSAYEVLIAEDKVDVFKILLLGHSEGTMLAPLVAKEKEVAGLILLGVIARKLPEVMHYQFVERVIDKVKLNIKADPTGSISKEDFETFSKEYEDIAVPFDEIDRDNNKLISISDLRVWLTINFYKTMESISLMKKWIESHYFAKPNLITLVDIRKPILILHGLEDDQTFPEEAMMLQSVLEESEHDDFEIKYFEELGHAFSKNKGELKTQPTIGPIDHEVLDYIGMWVQSFIK